MDTYKLPRVGETAPAFTARSTSGTVNFPADFAGRWAILYVYIGDFQPGCTTDILALSDAAPRLRAYNTEVMAMSPDSIAAHIAWIFSLRNQNKGNNIGVDLISDRSLDVAKLYGVTNVGDDLTKLEKMAIIVDADGVVQAVHKIPHAVGINTTELERELLSLQTARYQFAMTPSGWTPGEDIIEFPPQTVATAGNNISEKTANGSRCIDWYLCYRQDSGLRRASKTSQVEAQRDKPE